MEIKRNDAIRHRFAGSEMTMQMTDDGRLATLHIPTETAPPFPLELDMSKDPHALIEVLLSVAREAGHRQDVPQQLTDKTRGDVVVIPTTGWGVNMGPPGYALLVVRVGTVDLGFQISGSQMQEVASKLAQLAAVFAQEPGTAQ